MMTQSIHQLFRCGTLLLAFALVLCASNLHAQQAKPKREVPTGVLLQPIPAFEKWTVIYSYPSDRQNQAASVPGAPPTPPAPPPSGTSPRTVTITKTSDILLEETTNVKGDHAEKWCIGATSYWKPAGSTSWSQGSAVAQTLFNHLDWVLPKTYVATIPYGSHTCFVFMPDGTATEDLQNPDTLISKLPTLNQLVLIDSATRLPVEERNGGVYQIYRFDSPPTQKLTVSPELTAALKKTQEQAAQLTARPGRPY